MNNWITWWARAQRGVGLMPEKCPPRIEIDIHDLPQCSAIRLTFGTCYDNQPVTIKNIYCYSDDGQKTPVTIHGQTMYQLQPQQMITTDEIHSQDFTGDVHLVYEIETYDDYLCASGFGLETYDHMSSSSPLIYLLRSIDIAGSSIKGCIVAFGDSITEQGHWTTPLSQMLKEQGYALLQLGISGNRLLRELENVNIRREYHEDIHLEHKIYTQIPLDKQCFGKAAIKRFQDDVLNCCSCQALILAIGVNDLYQPGTFCANIQEFPALDDMIHGYQCIQKLFPSEKTLSLAITSFMAAEASSIGKEKFRQQINDWLNKHYEYSLSFDEWLLNEFGQIKNEYHNGDYLHPNEEAGKIMAQKIMQKLQEGLICGLSL